MQYVPLVKSAVGDKLSYDMYYYLAWRGVTVGRKAVRLSMRAFAANAAGSRGTIVDSSIPGPNRVPACGGRGGDGGGRAVQTVQGHGGWARATPLLRVAAGRQVVITDFGGSGLEMRAATRPSSSIASNSRTTSWSMTWRRRGWALGFRRQSCMSSSATGIRVEATNYSRVQST
jgi:hypothetical protein